MAASLSSYSFVLLFVASFFFLCFLPALFHTTAANPTVPHVISHYTLIVGNRRWLKSNLTYVIHSNVPAEAWNPIRSSFKRWSDAVPELFKFEEVLTIDQANLKISFKGGHSFIRPTDLARSYPPTRGILHFNADAKFSFGPLTPGFYDVESEAMHQIGHLLGLGHTLVKDAIMYTYLPPATRKINLHPDDIEGIRSLYAN